MSLGTVLGGAAAGKALLGALAGGGGAAAGGGLLLPALFGAGMLGNALGTSQKNPKLAQIGQIMSPLTLAPFLMGLGGHRTPGSPTPNPVSTTSGAGGPLGQLLPQLASTAGFNTIGIR